MSYICQTPVALIFFNRPKMLSNVFDKVREAKPKKLYLIQDGPRNEDDVPKIMECRKIVENIDWECEVIKDYSEINLGCGVRPQSGITNALKNEESIIILEDDCVPANSFFPYCEEMLEKYKDDERICYISGTNHFEEWDCGESDYFFAKTGAIAAWAVWRRTWSEYNDYHMKDVDINDKYYMPLIKSQITNKYMADFRVNAWRRAKNSLDNGEKLSYWDIQWGFVKYSQNMLVIVPKYNQICNIGTGDGSTHAASLAKQGFRKYKNFVFIPTRELEMPLKHPKYCVCDTKYDDLVYKCSAGNPIRRTIAKIVKKIIGRK